MDKVDGQDQGHHWSVIGITMDYHWERWVETMNKYSSTFNFDIHIY